MTQAAQLAAVIGVQMLQEALAWQQKVAAGKITMADVDAKLAERKQGSRAELVAAIEAAEKEGR